MATIKRIVRLKRRGAALPLVLSVIVILLVIGVGLLSLGLHGRTFTIRTGDEIAARCAADAGLTRALFEMNDKLEVEPWDDSTMPEATDQTLPNCDATYSYTVTGDIDSGFSIESTGRAGRVQRKVSCTLPLEGQFEYAIFGRERITLKSGTSVDWYNYGPDDEDLQVGTSSTNSDILYLGSNASINGDVVVGVGGDPDVVIRDYGATVTGQIYAMSEEQQLPSITVPQWLEQLPSGGDIKEPETITSSGKYRRINLKHSDIVTINGPVTLYVTDGIILNESAELMIVDTDTNPDAHLVLYLGGNFEGRHGSSLNNKTADPRKLKIYGLDSCTDMRFKNNSKLYSAVYAPNADVIFDNSAEAFGAIIARNFEQKNSAAFYYDASLRDVSINNDEAVRFTVKQWREE